MPKSVNAMLAAAFKAITVPDLDDARLVPEQAERFVRVVERASVMLGETRRLNLTADRRNIDRTGFSQRILKAAQAEGQEFTGETSPDFFMNQLVAEKGRGRVWISDEALEENIERDNFESTLVDMIAERAAVDLEEAFLAGDTAGAGDDFIDEIDGWLKKAEDQLTQADFDENDVEDVFETMLLTVDDKYIRDRGQWRFYVTFEIENRYRNKLRERGTQLGDTAQTQNQPVFYKGIRLQVVPTMPGERVLLTEVNNTVYGIRRDIQIEPERKASHDRWDFHVRVKADAHYEDELAAVAADLTPAP